MTQIPVVWLPPGDQWDHALLRDLLGGPLSPVGYTFRHIDGLPAAGEGAVVVVPGRYPEAEDMVAGVLAGLEWAVVIVTGDEESSFTFQSWGMEHPSFRWWFMHPRPDLHQWIDPPRFIGSGYPPHLRELLAPLRSGRRDLDWSFSGQVNHPRRVEAVEALGKLNGGELLRTPGFTRGLPHDAYARLLANTKAVPAPSGPHSPDSFRLFEALEAGCVPVADATCPAYDAHGYWQFVFGGAVPFQEVDDWNDAGKMIDAAAVAWPEQSNRCSAWWQLHKRRMRQWLTDDLRHFGQHPTGLDAEITVVIPTSPIPSHPSLAMIEQTIDSVRYWLPDAEILVMVDGVRDEQADRRADYQEYQRRLLWRMNFDWERVTPVRFDTHHHQAAMLRHTLGMISTPLVLFAEHDTPLVVDEPLRLGAVAGAIKAGELNVVRFFHEGVRQPDHRHLELDEVPLDSVPWTAEQFHYIRTMQWSQRPHLASAAFYRWLMQSYFTGEARTMIEDVLHGKAHESLLNEGPMGWNLWRVGIYAETDTGNLKRSYHLDGRGEDSKYEDRFIK